MNSEYSNDTIAATPSPRDCGEALNRKGLQLKGNDVILGLPCSLRKVFTCRDHQGNKAYMKLILSEVKCVELSSNLNDIARKIVASMHESKARFLECNDEEAPNQAHLSDFNWHEVSNARAVEKTARALFDKLEATEAKNGTIDINDITSTPDLLELTPEQAHKHKLNFPVGCKVVFEIKHQTEQHVDACVSTVKSVSLDLNTGNRFYLLNSQLEINNPEQKHMMEKDLSYAPQTPVAFEAVIDGKKQSMKGEVSSCSLLFRTMSNGKAHSQKSYTVLVQLENSIQLFKGIDEDCIQYLRTENVEPIHLEHNQIEEDIVELMKSATKQTKPVTNVIAEAPFLDMFRSLASLACDRLHENPYVLTIPESQDKEVKRAFLVLQDFLESIHKGCTTKVVVDDGKVEDNKQKNLCIGSGTSDDKSPFGPSAKQKGKLKEMYSAGFRDAIASRPYTEKNNECISRKRSSSPVDNESDDDALQTNTSKYPKTLDTTYDILTWSKLSLLLVPETLYSNNCLPITERQAAKFANKRASTGEVNKTCKSPDSDITYPDNNLCTSMKENQESGPNMSFPLKLFNMLAQENPAVIQWIPTGEAFRIIDEEKFSSDVLPRYFRAQKLASFQRNLNIYGFHRNRKGSNKAAYYHEFFHRDRPDLLSNIKRCKMQTPENSLDLAPATL